MTDKEFKKQSWKPGTLIYPLPAVLVSCGATPEEYNPQPLFDALPDGIFNICVAHLPQLWPKCAPSCDLMLAGHVHATQIKFSCGNISLSPAMLMYKEWSGHYSDGDSHLYITDGIGSVGFNLRLGAKPEITLLELRSR